MSRHNGSGGHTDSVKLGLVRVFNFFSFSMNDDEAFRGADDAPVMAVADFIHGLKHQLAQLTKMVQTGVKLETVGIEERQSVKDALSGLDGGDVFNEAVAALYQQAEVLMVEGTCFTCHKPGHVARDWVQQRELPTCYHCNKVGHIAPPCRTCDVYATLRFR